MDTCSSMLQEFLEFVEIDAESGHEGAIASLAEIKLAHLGMSVARDDAGSHFGGEAGNVIGRLVGPRVDHTREPILLCAHLDRVTPGNGVRPRVMEDRIASSGDTVLGADDIAGVVAILAGVRLALDTQLPLPPVEVVFTVSEEPGLRGSKHMDYSLVKSRIGYVLDAAGPVGTVIVASPTHVALNVAITGRSAHAALNPEDGISAIQIAAEAMAKIPFGRLDRETTSNIGAVHGGSATNIVCDRVDVRGEVRSLDNTRALTLAEQFADVFRHTAEQRGGSARAEIAVHYPCYRVAPASSVVARAERVFAVLGRTCTLGTTMGGSDANMFNLNGIDSVCLGMGFEQVHSCRETMPLDELICAAHMVRELILAGE